MTLIQEGPNSSIRMSSAPNGSSENSVPSPSQSSEDPYEFLRSFDMALIEIEDCNSGRWRAPSSPFIPRVRSAQNLVETAATSQTASAFYSAIGQMLDRLEAEDHPAYLTIIESAFFRSWDSEVWFSKYSSTRMPPDFSGGLRGDIVLIGFNTIERLLEGSLPKTLVEVYSFLSVCYGLSKVNLGPELEVPKQQTLQSVRILRRCIFIPNDPDETSHQRSLFTRIVNVLYGEIQCAVGWLKNNAPEILRMNLERLDDMTIFSDLLESDQVESYGLSHSDDIDLQERKKKPPISTDALEQSTLAEVFLIPAMKLLVSLADTMMKGGLTFICLAALLCPTLASQKTSNYEHMFANRPDDLLSSTQHSLRLERSRTYDQHYSQSYCVEDIGFTSPLLDHDFSMLSSSPLTPFPYSDTAFEASPLAQSSNLAYKTLAIEPTSASVGSTIPVLTGQQPYPTVSEDAITLSSTKPSAKQVIKRPNTGHIFCPKCPRRFTHRNNLIRHSKQHTDGQSGSGVPARKEVYTCSISGCQAYRSGPRAKENFQQHMRDEHPGQLEMLLAMDKLVVGTQ